MQPLADAARCRSEADWLIGINGTRAMTAFNSKEGGFYKTPVGRVQTPTLAIMVEREARIRAFVPRDYWEVEGEFQCVAGTYRGRWFDEKFKKAEDEHARAERLWDEARADAIRRACLGQHGAVEEESKPKTEACPMLYDLTSLQREANGRFGFSAKNTLGLAQALYEKHKVLTYPRTDSRHLPEDYLGTVKETLSAMAGTPYATFAGAILKNGWVHPNKRIFNNAKVSDHFAIIPTGAAPKSLSEPEQKIYDLVTKRFLAIFYPSAEYNITTRITRVEKEAFKTEGKVLVTPGWLAVYGKEAQGDEETPNLPPLEKNERIWAKDVEVKGKATQPPPRFTEATLLTAMEGAGKLIDDEELREAMSERGLGTPATRAATIEGLLAEEYLHRNGRELQPTAKAFSLLFALTQLQVDEIRSPELTGEWEYKLKEMEQGRLSRDEFMKHIVEQTQVMVERIKTGEFADPDFGTLNTPCPRCGAKIHEGYKHFACEKVRLQAVESGRQPAVGNRRNGRTAVETHDRTVAGFPQQNGTHLRRDHQAQGRPYAGVRFRQVRRRRRCRGSRFQRPRKRWAPAPSARAASSSMAWPMSARKAWARAGPATSVPARSSCSRKSDVPTCRSCWPPAAPTCSRASSRTRRGASFPPSWCVTPRPARSVSSSSRARPRRAPRPKPCRARRMPPTNPR
jgi:DNA topoisomerase-3